MLIYKFMRFKMWLENSENKYSWLDPSGFFHPVTVHYEGAIRILMNRYNIKSINANNAVLLLMEKGWMRVTYYTGELLAHNDFMLPNPRQVSALKNLAIELKMDKIEFDNGKDLKTIFQA